MAFLYILYSQKLGRFYTGSCIDFEKRIYEHKCKSDNTSFSSKAEDWEVFIMIDNLGYQQARDIEAHVKRMKSSKYIRDIKRYPDMLRKIFKVWIRDSIFV
jgi:putative endonuclease